MFESRWTIRRHECIREKGMNAHVEAFTEADWNV
jgi:hypothetical protein